MELFEALESTSAVICVRTPVDESPGTAATSSQVAALPTRRPAAPLFSEAEIWRLSATYLQHQCVDSECCAAHSLLSV